MKNLFFVVILPLLFSVVGCGIAGNTQYETGQARKSAMEAEVTRQNGERNDHGATHGDGTPAPYADVFVAQDNPRGFNEAQSWNARNQEMYWDMQERKKADKLLFDLDAEIKKAIEAHNVPLMDQLMEKRRQLVNGSSGGVLGGSLIKDGWIHNTYCEAVNVTLVGPGAPKKPIYLAQDQAMPLSIPYGRFTLLATSADDPTEVVANTTFDLDQSHKEKKFEGHVTDFVLEVWGMHHR